MEGRREFSVYHKGVFIQRVVAHTKWEAVDRVFNALCTEHPELNRQNLQAR
jgi:hypothetical protein